MEARNHWIVAADGRRASLYSCRLVPGGRFQALTSRHIENGHEGEHEHHRPSLLGRGPSASAAQHFAGHGHSDEEEQRRFAREVANWLSNAAREFRMERVAVFAAPRFLGLLRTEMGDLGGRADLHEGELARLEAGELAEHPAVRRALAGSISAAGTRLGAGGNGARPARVPARSDRDRSGATVPRAAPPR